LNNLSFALRFRSAFSHLLYVLHSFISLTFIYGLEQNSVIFLKNPLPSNMKVFGLFTSSK